MRGQRTERGIDGCPEAFPIGDDLVGPKAQDTPPSAFHEGGAASVGRDLMRMMLAVDFDNDFSFDGGEVGEVRTD